MAPCNDAGRWLKFCLRAHHMQGQTQQRRFEMASRLGHEMVRLISEHRLPERTFDALYDAAIGLKVRRQRYIDAARIDQRTATRDLTELTNIGLLEPRSQTRGRYYVGSIELLQCRNRARQGLPSIVDPYPGFVDKLRATPLPVAGSG